MLRLKEFDVHTPESLAELTALLARLDDAMILAGGTDLVPKLKRGQFEPSDVVSLSRVKELEDYEARDDGLRIGARVTLSTLERWEAVERFPCFHQALREIATPIIRNSATLGGNLLQDTRCRYYDRGYFWRDAVGYCLKKGDEDCRVAPGGHRCFASLCSDLAPALVVLGAEVTVVGDESSTLALERLYHDDGLDPFRLGGRVLTEVRVPYREMTSTYRKLRLRGGFDFPEVGLALAVAGEGERVDARVAVSGVSSGVIFVEESIQRDRVDAFCDSVYNLIKPMDTLFFSPAYRKTVTRNLLRQALHDLLAT